jgi:hypothetical protein
MPPPPLFFEPTPRGDDPRTPSSGGAIDKNKTREGGIEIALALASLTTDLSKTVASLSGSVQT